jgi:lipid-binding SYLF domain-containing protein
MPLRSALHPVVAAAVLMLAFSAHAQQASTPPAAQQDASPKPAGQDASPRAAPQDASPKAAKAAATALSRDSQTALRKLYAQVPAAKALGERASAVLVFPNIRKAGLVDGGQYGEGTLIKGGKPAAYYSTTARSYGLQAGAQHFAYALFFMNDSAAGQLDKAEGFEVGVGPKVVVVDPDMAKNVSTTTMNDDIYGFVFAQKGLLAGVGLQGNKVKRIAAK